MTEQPSAATGAEPQLRRRRLHRRTDDRVIGGVAAGLADHLNIDPLLVRAGFAGLMIFGGAGLVLYVLAWLLIPAEGRNGSILDEAFTRHGIRYGRVALAVVSFVGVAIIGAWLVGYERSWYRDTILIAAAIVALGVLILRWGGRSGADGPAVPGSTLPTSRVDGVAASDGAEASPAEREASWLAVPDRMVPAAAVERPPREPSALGWYAGAAALGIVGLLAIAANLPGYRVTIGQYLGAVVAVLGLGLVVGAWWGRARILIALGLLVAPGAIVAAFVTVPLGGGIGDVEFAPRSVGELRPEYRLAAGDLWVDLRDFDPNANPAPITASVGIGRLVVVVPEDRPVEIDARVSGGGLALFGSRQIGTGLGDRIERPTGSARALVLELEVGIGGLVVESAEAAAG